MTTVPVAPGDNVIKIAQEQLGDWRRWREIADLNDFDVTQALPIIEAQLPELSGIAATAQPILTAIAQGRNGGGDISSLLLTAAQATGYGQAATKALGLVNGVQGAVESINGGEIGDRGYAGGVQLVDWLLQ